MEKPKTKTQKEVIAMKINNVATNKAHPRMKHNQSSIDFVLKICILYKKRKISISLFFFYFLAMSKLFKVMVVMHTHYCS